MFRKLFLWFLFGMLLVITVSASLTIFMAREGIILTGREDILSAALESHGLRCLEIYQEEGPLSLRDELKKIFDQTGFFIHILDEKGRPLWNFPHSGRVRDLWLEAKKSGREVINRRDLVAVFKEIRTEDGKKYILIGVLPKRPLFPGFIRNPKALLILVVGFLFSVMLLAYVLTKHITGPVLQLSEVAKAVTEGNFSVRVGDDVKRRKDEIGQLGLAFDEMTSYVNELLEAQNRLLRDVSHELRSPLARLMVALELARKDLPESNQRFLDRVEREASTLGEMIGHILSVSRLEQEMGKKMFSENDLIKLVKSVIEDSRIEAEKDGKEILFRSQFERLIIPMRVEMLKSAIENVLRNAIRYTPVGGQIQIKVEDGDDHMIRVSIRDQGEGVPIDQIDKLFKPFYRVETSRNRKKGGVGLGLAIAKRALEYHGGRIEAANAPDGGLVVTMWLPLAKK